MATGNTNVLEILIKAQNQVGPGLASAQQQIQGFSQSATAALAGIGKALVAFQVIDQAVDSMKRFVEAEAGMRALQASLESVGADVRKVTGDAEKLILAWEQASVFDDDELRAAFTNMVTITGQATGSFGVMQAAMDLAAARGISLAQATELIGRAVEGSSAALSRYGIRFDEASQKVFKFGSELDRMAVIAERIQEGMGGRAQAQIEAYAGKVALVKNAWGDAQESLGKFLVEGLAGIVKFGERVGNLADQIGNYFRIMRGQAPIDIRMAGVESGGRTSVGIQAAADAARAHAAAEEARQKALDASRKATEAAARAAGQYAAELDAMVNRGPEWDRSQRMLAQAIKIVDAALGDGAGARAFKEELLKIDEAARETAATIRGDLQSAIESILPQIPFGASFEQFARLTGRIALKVPIQPVITLDAFELIERDLQRSLAESGARGLEDAVTDFALTGGKNLSGIVEAMVAEGARAGAKALIAILAQAVGKGRVSPQQPGESAEAYAQRTQEAGMGVVGQYAQYAAGAAQIYSIAQSNQRGQTSDLQTVLGTTLTGASVGGLYGAIAGLIVGGISAALSSAGDKDKYGVLSFEGGRARFAPGQNIALREAEEIQQRAQGIWNTIYDGFAKVLLKLQDFVPNFIRNMDAEFVRGLEAGGYVGREASPNFLKHLDRLITEGIPSELGQAFKPVFGEAFQAMGFTTERFNEIWGELEQMDAQKSIQMLGMLVDAMVKIREAMEDFDTPIGGFDVFRRPLEGSMLAEVDARRRQSFAESLREADKEIMRLAGTLDDLTTEGQIQTLGQIADLEEQRQQSILRFLEQVLAISEQVNASIEAGISELELRGITDPQARIDYLEAQLQADRQLLLAATSPEEAQRIADRMQRNIFRIIGEAEILGPDAVEQYRQWGIDALRGVQGDFNARMDQLLADVEQRNREFMDAWRPVYDRWMTELDNASTPLAGFGDGLDRGTDRLRQFESALGDATAAVRSNATAGGGGETVVYADSGASDAAEESAFVNSVVMTRGMRGRVS